MITTQLSSIFHLLETKLQTKWWILITAIVATAVSLFFTYPNYVYMKQQIRHETLTEYAAQEIVSEHPFVQNTDTTVSAHAEKLAFRLTLPIIAKVFHLRTGGMFALFNILGFGIFVLSALLMFKITGDRVLSFLFTVGLGNIYVGTSGFTDVNGLADIVPYFFLLLAMATRIPLLIFAGVFLASWGDERAFVAAGFVYLFFALEEDGGIASIGQIFRFNKRTVAVVLAWVAYGITRLYLILGLGFKTKLTQVGMAIFLKHRMQIGLSLWSAFEGYWIFIILFLLALVITRHYLYLFMSFGVLSVIIFAALLCLDTTKSISYGFPIFFLIFAFVSNKMEKQELRWMVAICAVVCILCPTINIIERIEYPTTLYQEFVSFVAVRLR